MQAPNIAANDEADLVAFRRDLHAHPELRFEEHRTANKIVQKLNEFGIECHTGLAQTAVIGVIRGLTTHEKSPSIGLRADMDALPLTEANGFEHKSTYQGKMHACGHDGHVATLLAAARWLANHRHAFCGTVNLIFQPAEEGGGGARVMIQEGFFEQFPCDQVFALHNWPGLAEGVFGVRSGPIMASSNEFEIKVVGRGAHAAMPHNGIDPVVIASHLIQAFQSIVSRNVKPVDTAVVSVTMVQAGEATNIIPDHCTLSGTVRTFSLPTLDMIESRMREMSHQICAAFGAQCVFDFSRNYPPTVNHPGPTQVVESVIRETFGAHSILSPVEPTMGAEDFAYFLQERPGCYLFLGNGEGSHRASGHGLGPCDLHNPSYDFNDRLIPIGAEFWSRLVERCLPLER